MENASNTRYVMFLIARFMVIMSTSPVDIMAVYRLSSSRNSVVLFGITMLVELCIVLVFQPFLSSRLDRIERKTVQKVNNTLMIVVLGSMLIIYTYVGLRNNIIYSVYLVINGVFFSVVWQTFNAMVQTVGDREQYGKLAGLMEMMGQSPVVLGALVSAAMFAYYGFTASLILSLALLCISLAFLYSFEERFVPDGKLKKTKAGAGIRENADYIRKNSRLVMYIFLLNFPFIAIVTGNFLKPIYISQVLHGGPSTLAISEGVYALAAILAGLVMPRINRHIGYFLSIYTCTIVFIIGSVIMPLFPFFAAYFLFQTFHGFGNPGIRVSRNTLVMKNIPREEMGRFNGAIQLLTTPVRIILLTVFMITVGYLGPGMLIFISGMLVMVASTLSLDLYRSSPQLKAIFATEQMISNAGVV